MKKLLIMMLMANLIVSVFSFEGFTKESYTEDEYFIQIYQIDKSDSPDSFEFYVKLVSEDSKELFIWCFDKVGDAMEHFKWLESTYSRRSSWRTYAFDSEIKAGEYVLYWILKSENFLESWR